MQLCQLFIPESNAMRRLFSFILLLGCAGCIQLQGDPSPLPPLVTIVQPGGTPATNASPAPDLLPGGLLQANAVMRGICFESANDAAGQVFVLRSAEEHIRFYNLADESTLCRLPVARNAFDFSDGRILAGLWSRGRGCDANHDILNVQRDDAGRRISIDLRFTTDGDCNYELVQPFWVGIPDAADYEVSITVQEG